MENYLLLGVGLLVAVYGRSILERLPKSHRHQAFKWEPVEFRVDFRIKTLLEDTFDVSYVDGWNVGRSFAIYGPVIQHEDEEKQAVPDLTFGKRTGVRITATADWFDSSRLGTVLQKKDGCETYIALPYQIANRLLDELRRDPKQVASIGIKKAAGKEGKPRFEVYSFELSPNVGWGVEEEGTDQSS